MFRSTLLCEKGKQYYCWFRLFYGFPFDRPGAPKQSVKNTIQLKLFFYACGETFLTIFWNNVHELTLAFSTLVHSFENKPKPSIPAALSHVPSLPPPLSLIGPKKKKKQQKKTKNSRNKCRVNPVLFSSPMELLMSLCINLAHLDSNTHTHTGGSLE